MRAWGWLAVCIASCACGGRINMSSQEIPILQVRPGMSVAEVERAAELHLNYSTLFDNSAIAMDRPVRVTYADRQYGFELPPSRFVWLPQRAGVITGIETTTGQFSEWSGPLAGPYFGVSTRAPTPWAVPVLPLAGRPSCA